MKSPGKIFSGGININLNLVLVIASIFITVAACKKDNNPEPDNSAIKIGIHKGLEIDSTVIQLTASYNNGEQLQLDLNNNDTADVRLVVAMYGSPGMGVYYTSSLLCLNHKIKLFGAFFQDTVFLRQNISCFSDEYNNYHTTVNYYNCRKLDSLYQVFITRTDFHPLKLNPGEVLKRVDTFASDSISFIYSWSGGQSVDYSNDTVYISSSRYDYSCHALPYGEDIYLGFKFTDQTERLGWIRFVLGFNTITLKEYAIQP